MIVALSFCETRRISSRVARKGKSGTYPTLPHKANTGDLSRFVGAILTVRIKHSEQHMSWQFADSCADFLMRNNSFIFFVQKIDDTR